MSDVGLFLRTHAFVLLAMTLVAFELTHALYVARGKPLILSPLIWSVGALVGLLITFDIPYAVYADATRPLRLMLGPTTVALAIPLYEQRHRVRATVGALSVSVVLGSLVGICAATGLMAWLTRDPQMALSAAPKSVTTPVAIVISEKVGGLPALTAGLVLLTAIFGAAAVPALLKHLPGWLQVRTDAARGLGLGMSAHGLGTARAFQESDEMGIYAGIAIGLNGFLTAVFVPQLVRFLVHHVA